MRNTFLLSLLLLFGLVAGAQTTQVKNYYSNANHQKGQELKTALHRIIKVHKERKYDDLWQDFRTTDKRSDGSVWDMYSKTTHYTFGRPAQGASARGEGDGYNREHSFPKSWFNDGYPMYTDLFHLYPVDVYLNTRRSNYPYGETQGERFRSEEGWSKLGACTVAGYTGIVFEPNDEYKGDLARTYFYMVTAYEDKITSWRKADGVKATLNGTTYPAFTDWQLGMLLRWAKQDPVSEKEIARNNAVYQIQQNRNPFIDFPGLEQFVWGDSVNSVLDLMAYTNPYTGQRDTTATDSTFVVPTDSITQPKDSTGGGTVGSVTKHEYALVKQIDELTDGTCLILVAVTKNVAMAENENSNFMGTLSVEVVGDKVAFDDVPETLLTLTLRKVGNAYAFETPDHAYLSYTGSRNELNTSATSTELSALWNITIGEDGNATISNVANPARNIRYNASSPRFSTYTSAQTPVAIFKDVTVISGLYTVLRPEAAAAHNYDLSGRRVKKQRGIVIRQGEKIWK